MQRHAEAVFQNAGIDIKTAEQRGSHRCVVHFDTALVHVYFGLLYGCTACGCAYPSTRIGTDSAMSSTQVSVTSRMKASSVEWGTRSWTAAPHRRVWRQCDGQLR